MRTHSPNRWYMLSMRAALSALYRVSSQDLAHPQCPPVWFHSVTPIRRFGFLACCLILAMRSCSPCSMAGL